MCTDGNAMKLKSQTLARSSSNSDAWLGKSH